jgi:peptide-methionine (S)-S-oxide reductase
MLDALLHGRKKTQMIDRSEALPGRETPGFVLPERHEVLGTPLRGPFPANLETAYFGLGCFWGAEKIFWQLPGVYSTAAGYQGGYTPNPTYEEVCSSRTGHAEIVQVVYDPAQISYDDLLRVFWESHDPTQGMRQGNDLGTQYRSAIFTTSDAQREAAEKSREVYNNELRRAGFGEVTTEIAPAGPFFYAEDYHQQYLHKVPNGYCPHHATGIACPAWGSNPVAAGAQAGG